MSTPGAAGLLDAAGGAGRKPGGIGRELIEGTKKPAVKSRFCLTGV